MWCARCFARTAPVVDLPQPETPYSKYISFDVYTIYNDSIGTITMIRTGDGALETALEEDMIRIR